MPYPGNTLPADLDVDHAAEITRALDLARERLQASHALAFRLAGGAGQLDRLDQAAGTLRQIEMMLPALEAAQAALERNSGLLAGARAELAAQAWPERDARPILERLEAAQPQLDRLAQVMDLLEQAEVIAWHH